MMFYKYLWPGLIVRFIVEILFIMITVVLVYLFVKGL